MADTIVFLDFDGVLNSEKDLNDTWDCFLSREKVEILNRLPRTLPDLLFVLSNSWREEYLINYDFDARNVLREHGFQGNFHTDWRTPSRNVIQKDPSRHGWIRGDEALTWLENNGLQHVKYAILDDMPDFHQGQPLVQTDAKTGLTDEDVDKVIAILSE